MFGLKISNKNKRKLIKTPAIQFMNSSIEGRILHNVPSVSKIAPLPENRSHGILPVLSLDGRDSPDFINAEDDRTSETGETKTHQPVGNKPIFESICMVFNFIMLIIK
jgi:hypothetical protein